MKPGDKYENIDDDSGKTYYSQVNFAFPITCSDLKSYNYSTITAIANIVDSNVNMGNVL